MNTLKDLSNGVMTDAPRQVQSVADIWRAVADFVQHTTPGSGAASVAASVRAKARTLDEHPVDKILGVVPAAPRERGVHLVRVNELEAAVTEETRLAVLQLLRDHGVTLSLAHTPIRIYPPRLGGLGVTSHQPRDRAAWEGGGTVGPLRRGIVPGLDWAVKEYDAAGDPLVVVLGLAGTPDKLREIRKFATELLLSPPGTPPMADDGERGATGTVTDYDADVVWTHPHTARVAQGEFVSQLADGKCPRCGGSSYEWRIHTLRAGAANIGLGREVVVPLARCCTKCDQRLLLNFEADVPTELAETIYQDVRELGGLGAFSATDRTPRPNQYDKAIDALDRKVPPDVKLTEIDDRPTGKLPADEAPPRATGGIAAGLEALDSPELADALRDVVVEATLGAIANALQPMLREPDLAPVASLSKAVSGLGAVTRGVQGKPKPPPHVAKNPPAWNADTYFPPPSAPMVIRCFVLVSQRATRWVTAKEVAEALSIRHVRGTANVGRALRRLRKDGKIASKVLDLGEVGWGPVDKHKRRGW